MKNKGIRFDSRWDASTWSILLFEVLVCIWPVVYGDWLFPVILALCMVAATVISFKGTYYCIDGDRLVIYQLFRPTALPIDRISEISPTKSMLAAPATSLTHRLAIKFSDRKILKSSMPVMVSPVRQDEFIARLTSINPAIRVVESQG